MGQSSKAASKRSPETKRDRFVRLAEKRVSKALQAIRLIANLSNRNNYDYDPGDSKKIAGALSREVDELKRKFERQGDRTASGFKL
jgi:hypothetical protein